MTLVGTASLFLLLVNSLSAVAAELPKELLLQCEGTATAFVLGNHPSVRQLPFKTVLRLRRGEIVDTVNNMVQGKNCALANDIIRCEKSTVERLPVLHTMQAQHSAIVLHRNTGEVKTLLETWNGKKGDR